MQLTIFQRIFPASKKKKTLLNLVSPACATFLAERCTTITRQTLELESCSNPLKMREVLQIRFV